MSDTLRLKWTDSNGDDQTISDLDNAVVDRKHKQLSYAKVHGGKKLFDDLPQKISEFNGSEPAILLQEYRNGTWMNEFRGFVEERPSINDMGECSVKLWSFEKFLGEQRVQLSNVQGTIVDVMQAALPSGYVLEFDGNMSHPSIESYSIDDERSRVFQEMVTVHNYTVDFVAEQDGGGDWKVKFYKKGRSSPVGTIYSRESEQTALNNDGDAVLAKFNEWDKGDTQALVNKVTLFSAVPDGQGGTNNITSTQSDSTSINEFGERFRRLNIPWLNSQSEADDKAQEIVDNYKDEDEGGKVTTQRFTENLIGETLNVYSSLRSVSGGSFAVTQQKNYYPSGDCELVLAFENHGFNEVSGRVDTVRNVVQRSAKTSDSDVGGSQTKNIRDDDDPNQYDNVSDPNHQHNVEGFTTQSNISSSDYNYNQTGGSATNGSNISETTDAPFVSAGDGVDYVIINANVTVGNSGDYDILIENTTSGNTIFSESVTSFLSSQSFNFNVVSTATLGGDEIEITVTNDSGSTASISLDLSVISIGRHDHSVNEQTDGTSQDDTGNTNEVETTREQLDLLQKAIKLLEREQQDR